MARTEKSGQARKCLAACDRPAKVRGLCMRCYMLARRAAADGKTTMADLEAKGLILPANRSGRPSGAWKKRFPSMAG